LQATTGVMLVGRRRRVGAGAGVAGGGDGFGKIGGGELALGEHFVHGLEALPVGAPGGGAFAGASDLKFRQENFGRYDPVTRRRVGRFDLSCKDIAA